MLEVGLPAIVFLAACAVLVRKAWKAARTERELEENRLEGAFAAELAAARARAAGTMPPERPAPEVPAARDPFDGADLSGADPAHLGLLRALVEAQLRPAEARLRVLWVRSHAGHVAWCERLTGPARAETIHVARVDHGAVIRRWSFP